MNNWNSLGLFLKLYVGIRLTISGHAVPGGPEWLSLLLGSVGAALLGWFTWDVVAYIKRNEGEGK